MTILGEAISNSWDADAENVWIYIDKKQKSLVIKDDGIGMDTHDFQNKFLKIGYSKRNERTRSAKKNRPYIGRKGIGKIALLSFAQRISILTRKSSNAEYVGGTIDNSGLDAAIQNDMTPDQYLLDKVDKSLFQQYLIGHTHGTIIYFEDITEGIRNSIPQIKKVIALYFRFSLLDDSFRIFVNDEPITLNELADLIEHTQFLWAINGFEEPFITRLNASQSLLEKTNITAQDALKGFIASVEKPRHLKIFATGEKIGVDLFVNGRLRERDLLRHIPSARVYENYLYGQIHYDELDDGKDRFTSNREGVIVDDPKFQELLKTLKKEVLPKIASQWDKWRLDHKEEGDPAEPRLTLRERKSRALFNVVSKDYTLSSTSPEKKKVDKWVDELEKDAQFNFTSYAECFVAENLIRRYIVDRKINLSPEAQNVKDKWKEREEQNKNKGNVSIEIRRMETPLFLDLSYLSMDDLANLVDKVDPNTKAGLSRDAKEYKPMRDAVAHTALLTDEAKTRLTTVYDNIKARIVKLLSAS